jgi:hypothetical protein
MALAIWPITGSWTYSVPSGNLTPPPDALPNSPSSVSCLTGSIAKRRPICFASTMMLSIIVTAMVPSSSSVVAAFFDLGFLNAGTPLLIASTPVSAAQPDEKARSSRKAPASPVIPCW